MNQIDERAAIELYVLLLLMFRRPWAAFLVAALSGANIVIVSYVKALLSEGLTLVFVTSLALAVALFIRSTRPALLWLVVMLLLALFLTCPEWDIPAVAALWVSAAHRASPRHAASFSAVPCRGGVVWGSLVICAILACRRGAPPRPHFKPDHGQVRLLASAITLTAS